MKCFSSILPRVTYCMCRLTINSTQTVLITYGYPQDSMCCMLAHAHWVLGRSVDARSSPDGSCPSCRQTKLILVSKPVNITVFDVSNIPYSMR